MIAGSHRGTSRPPGPGSDRRPAGGGSHDRARGRHGPLRSHPPRGSAARPIRTAAGRRALYLSYVPPLTFEMIGPGQGYNDVLFTRSAGHIRHVDELGTSGEPDDLTDSPAGLQSGATWCAGTRIETSQHRPASRPGCLLTSAPPTGAGTRPTRTSSRAGPSSDLIDGLRKAGEVLRLRRRAAGARGPGVGLPPPARAARSRHRRRAQDSDPYDPYFAPANVDNVLKWGMDCPDAAYTGAAIRGDATYVVRGNRQTVRYLGFQVMAGHREHRQHRRRRASARSRRLVRARAVAPSSPRTSRRRTGCRSPSGRRLWWCASSSTTGRTSVPPTSRSSASPVACRAPTRGALSAAGVANQLAALGEFVDASFRFWQRRRRRWTRRRVSTSSGSPRH